MEDNIVSRIIPQGSVPNVPVRYRTIGIDVDSQYLVTAFLDLRQEATQIQSYGNNANGIQDLARDAAAFKPEIVVLESTGQYSLSAYDALIDADLFAVCVNPLSIQALLRANGAKTDKNDSVTLARCGAMFPRLSWSNMPDRWQREVRLHLRIMDEAAARRMQCSLRLAAQMRQHGVDVGEFGGYQSQSRWRVLRLLRAEGNEAAAEGIVNKQRRAAIAEMLKNVRLTPALLEYRDEMMRHMDLALEAIRREEDWLQEQSKEPRTAEALRYVLTVPFTSRILGLRLLAECGRNFTQRYHSCDAFCAAIGVAPKNEITGGKVVAISEMPGRKALLTAFVSSLKGHMRRLPEGVDLWLTAYRGRGASYSKSVLALAHLIAEGWYNCTKLKRDWDPVMALGQRVPTRVEPTTGEVVLK
jgi:transposase